MLSLVLHCPDADFMVGVCAVTPTERCKNVTQTHYTIDGDVQTKYSTNSTSKLRVDDFLHT